MKLPKAGQMVFVFLRRVHVIRSKRFATYAECECYVNSKVQTLTFYSDGTYSNHDEPADSWLADKWDWSQKKLCGRMPFEYGGTIRHTFRMKSPAFDNLPKDARIYERPYGQNKCTISGRMSAAEPQPCSYPRSSSPQLVKVGRDGDTTKEPEMRMMKLSAKLTEAINALAAKEIPACPDMKEYVYVGTDA